MVNAQVNPRCGICGNKLTKTKLTGKWKCKECNYYLERELEEEVKDLKFSITQIKSILAALLVDDKPSARRMYEGLL